MTASPLQAPYCQFFDSNGDPLSGGKVWTYTAGTTTPKNSYTTSSGLVANTNPVILDSAGRADIYLIGSYRIDVLTSTDAPVESVDNLTAFSTGGNMDADVYDPANIAQQVVGTAAVQTLTNKTLTSPTLSTPVITGFSTASTENRGILNGGSFTNSTYADLTNMTWALGVGVYDLKFSCRVDQLAAGGNKLQILFDGTQTAFQATYVLWNVGTTTPLAMSTVSAPGALTSSTTGTTNFWQVDVKINVTVAGTLKFQGAQQSTNASATTFAFPTATCKLMS